MFFLVYLCLVVGAARLGEGLPARAPRFPLVIPPKSPSLPHKIFHPPPPPPPSDPTKAPHPKFFFPRKNDVPVPFFSCAICEGDEKCMKHCGNNDLFHNPQHHPDFDYHHAGHLLFKNGLSFLAREIINKKHALGKKTNDTKTHLGFGFPFHGFSKFGAPFGHGFGFSKFGSHFGHGFKFGSPFGHGFFKFGSPFVHGFSKFGSPFGHGFNKFGHGLFGKGLFHKGLFGKGFHSGGHFLHPFKGFHGGFHGGFPLHKGFFGGFPFHHAKKAGEDDPCPCNPAEYGGLCWSPGFACLSEGDRNAIIRATLFDAKCVAENCGHTYGGFGIHHFRKCIEIACNDDPFKIDFFTDKLSDLISELDAH